MTPIKIMDSAVLQLLTLLVVFPRKAGELGNQQHHPDYRSDNARMGKGFAQHLPARLAAIQVAYPF